MASLQIGDDPAEIFQLPQIKEMVEGLLDCAAVFLGPQFKPHSAEVERIAKPIATMLARRPMIQNAVKKFASPAVLVGAVGAYLGPRMLGFPRRSQHGSSMSRPDLRVVTTPAVSEQAPPVNDSVAEPQRFAQGQAPPIPPERAAELAAFAETAIADLRSRMPG